MSEYNRYDSGQLVRLSTTTLNFDGNPEDPTALEIRYKNPQTNQITSAAFPTDAAVVQDDTGTFHFDVDTTGFEAGAWHYKWVATGAIVAAEESAFIINEDGTD